MEMREHLEGLREAMVVLVRSIEQAGLRAPVPTAPEWRTRRLVAHVGGVHRWAAGNLLGKPVDIERVEATAMNLDDPLDWLREGTLELVAALMSKRVDPEALVFLANASDDPREFWARRQCHETTIHAVDAVAAALGRAPEAAEVDWITDDVALDGVDELLTGFLPRPRSRARADVPQRLALAVGERGWTIDLGDQPPVVRRDDAPDGDLLVRADPVPAYLGLWRRTPERLSADPRWLAFSEATAIV